MNFILKSLIVAALMAASHANASGEPYGESALLCLSGQYANPDGTPKLWIQDFWINKNIPKDQNTPWDQQLNRAIDKLAKFEPTFAAGVRQYADYIIQNRHDLPPGARLKAFPDFQLDKRPDNCNPVGIAEYTDGYKNQGWLQVFKADEIAFDNETISRYLSNDPTSTAAIYFHLALSKTIRADQEKRGFTNFLDLDWTFRRFFWVIPDFSWLISALTDYSFSELSVKRVDSFIDNSVDSSMSISGTPLANEKGQNYIKKKFAAFAYAGYGAEAQILSKEYQERILENGREFCEDLSTLGENGFTRLPITFDNILAGIGTAKDNCKAVSDSAIAGSTAYKKYTYITGILVAALPSKYSVIDQRVIGSEARPRPCFENLKRYLEDSKTVAVDFYNVYFNSGPLDSNSHCEFRVIQKQ